MLCLSSQIFTDMSLVIALRIHTMLCIYITNAAGIHSNFIQHSSSEKAASVLFLINYFTLKHLNYTLAHTCNKHTHIGVTVHPGGSTELELSGRTAKIYRKLETVGDFWNRVMACLRLTRAVSFANIFISIAQKLEPHIRRRWHSP